MKRILAILIFLVLASSIVTPVSAQGDYYFAVEKLNVEVYWNSDGTMSLDYTWVFVNQPGARVIDFVDVGTPNDSYGDILAEVNGKPVSISTDYQGEGGSGFAVDMGGYAIQPGQRGTVHVSIGRVEQVLYPDDNDEAYASAVFAPTWFGSKYVTGTTDYTVTFHFPPGVQPEEPRWHDAPSGFPSEPQTGFDELGNITYTWYNPAGDVSNYYAFGASFPKTYVPAGAIYTPPAVPSIEFDAVFPILFICCFGGIFLGIPIMGAINTNRRKLKYLPPKVSIQGYGIKRGLTAVEAAILMEQPLDKVMTMILFGALKKNAAEVVTRSPLKLKFASEAPADELHQYEKDFLKAFKEEKVPEQRKQLQEMTVDLVRSVSDKMKGFSRKETIDYYKSIMERAWKQVEEAGTPEVQSAKFDENLEWTMLDKDYDDRTRRAFHGPVYVPTWWGRYDPAYRPVSTGAGAKTISTPSVGGNRALPGADFAASVVGGVQNFSSKVIGNVNTFTEKITGVTNPPPKPTTSSYRGGGGGGRSCACACACAGCACACAGGGR